ncbi:MAG: M20/M25/M40 family metallo-hydrolase [Christensenellaceae bacterium]|nr:M20/M25/M40 family metallo-hydrolase [Christensenellaceae bacterium]
MQNKLFEIEQLLMELCRIPAPSNHEEFRAEFCLRWFRENCGEYGKKAFIDDALNVVMELNLEENADIRIVCAHTDTVFPEMVPFTPIKKDGRIYCPGVGDDTANLALLMIAAKDLIASGKEIKNLVIAANSGEEGLGNLKGTKALMQRYGSRVSELVTLDGGYDSIVTEAVGSGRYRVCVKTEGGHSFGEFGKRNAIAVASSLISSLYGVKVPKVGSSKTTYNVGMITGGTSVNTIAQDCEFLLECRSDNAECLKKMQRIFENMITAFNESISGEGQNGVTMETVGIRPCSEIDPAKEAAVAEKYAALLKRHTGKDVSFGSASTDCNIPLSMGIPAVCFGGYSGHGAHTREEYIEIESMKMGYAVVLDVLSMSF